MASSPQRIAINLPEWTQVTLRKESGLEGLVLTEAAAAQAAALTGKLIICPGFHGIEIESTSYVGQVSVGPLHIAIRPKLTGVPLVTLLRYAYGLPDLGPLRDPVATPLADQGIEDILAALLAAAAEELVYRGLARQYVSRTEHLESPRGRVLLGELARRGGVLEARLPCRHVERRADWRLNQVLRAGLRLAGGMAVDPALSRRILQLHARLDDTTPIHLDLPVLAHAERSLTRLTAAYGPALAIIRLLLEAQEAAAESGDTREIAGFLFDMNKFFQRLLSRFLHDNLPSDQQLFDEQSVKGLFAYALGANPRGRAVPQIRPDFTLVEATTPARYLDAKYRDVWDKGCTPEWLYQLGLYALASSSRVSVLLYATTNTASHEERVEIRPPGNAGPMVAATVIIRPVHLTLMAELVGSEGGRDRAAERRCMARILVAAHPTAMNHDTPGRL